MHETAFRAGDAQRIGAGEQLDEQRLAPPPELVSERRDAQHVVEVDDELLVKVGEGYVARQPPLGAPGLHRGELVGTACTVERPQFGLCDVPAGGAQHEPSADDPRQEGGMPERAPIPLEPGHRVLALKRAQEAVHAQVPPLLVMGGGEPRHDLALEAAGAQHDAAAAHRHQQVGDWNLAVGRRAGATEVGNLVIAQHRTAHGVADPAVRKVHDLGEQPLGPSCLLRLKVGQDELVQRLVGVAEPAKQRGARGPAHITQEHTEGALLDRAVGLGRHHGPHVEGIGEWTTLLRGQRLEVGRLKRDLAGPFGKRLCQLPQEQRIAGGPSPRLEIAAAEREPGQQRRGLGQR